MPKKPDHAVAPPKKKVKKMDAPQLETVAEMPKLLGMDEQFVQLLNRIAQNLKDRQVTTQRMDSLMRDVAEYEEALEKLEQEGRVLAAEFDAAWELNKERMLR